MTRSLVETAFSIGVVRWLAGLAFLVRAAAFFVLGRRYRALVDVCWVARVAPLWPFGPLADAILFRVIARLREGPNTLVDAYLADPASRDCADSFSIRGQGGPHDIFRDLIVLKAATPHEKGVILLKYVRTFDATVALFDFSRLLERYTFVLEPCWAGYRDPSLLLFLSREHPVFVQCFTRDDLAFVTAIGAPFVPLPLGPADWVNADVFRPPADVEKTHDLVMVANWAPHKRHALLFRALQGVRDRAIRVLLVGFPWAGRTAADVRREAAAYPNDLVSLDIIEGVPQVELAAHLSRCKAFVFLSKKEGDNKALVEAMFAGLPAIVYEKSIGGATSRINAATGLLTSDEQLTAAIREMLDRWQTFTPRAWALAHTGSARATAIVNDRVKQVTLERGGAYTTDIVEKMNAPNLAYRDVDARERFAADYASILEFQRRPA
jgi:glycosyltransferase involved in cell wall biosynthesis